MANRGSSTVGNMDPYKVPWFADCAPSLLTNRTIRRYLNAYSQHTWPEVIKLTLIYGVLGLEQQFPGGTLSIPQLRKLVERGGAQLVVQRNLPGLQRQILTLQSGLDAVFDRLAVEPPAPAGPGGPATTAQQLVSTLAGVAQPQLQQQQLAQVQQVQHDQLNQQQQQQVLEVAHRSKANSARPTSALNPGPVAPKPPDEWRLGEKTGFPSPPRTRDHPLRRSLDNQGATNPIYPDWWLAAGPPEPPKQKAVPQKVPRKQPRLAYSVQQQQQPEASPVADDIVTAEYLMVPGSGYGQAEPEAVVAGAGPPVMLTSITADTMQTNPLFDAGRQPATAVSGAAAARAAGPEGAAPTVAAGRVPRRPQAAQSKIKEAVAASRRKAAAQQQRRQLLLASAVAAGSSLFGSATQQQQEPPRGVSAAADAIAACAPAAAAEQFLSNPWTSSFLQPSALRADVGGDTQLPSADITADDEARLGAMEGQELALEELQQPRAPAAYAVLKRVVAGGNASPAAAAGGGGGGVDSVNLSVTSSEALSQAGLGPVAEVWSREGDERQEQVEQLLAQPGPSTAGTSSLGKGAAVSTRAAQTGSLRGVFADITSGLNSQVVLQGAKRAAAADGAGPSTRGVAASWGYSAPQAQVSNTADADAAMQQRRGASDSDDWRRLPLVDEQGEVQATQCPQQQQQQQQHQHAQQHHKAWACDYGHLQDVQPPPAKVSVRERRASGRPHKRWSETWVGDFGHLHQFPRFARETAFQPEGQAANDKPSQGSPPSSKLFMSPADLQALVAAADRLQANTQPTQADASSPQQLADTGMAAAADVAADDSTTEAEAGAVGASRAVAAAAEASSSAHSLAARFAELLSRWDAEAADSAGQLPAGLAARASVEHAAASMRAGAAATQAAEAAGVELGAAAAEEAAGDEASRTSSSSSYNTAGSDDEVAGGGQQGMAPAAGAAGQRTSRREEAAIGAAAADAAELLFNLQQAVSELSSIADSEAAGAAAEPVQVSSATTAAQLQAAAREARGGTTAAVKGGASAASLPAEGHLEGMQEASQMLQQALSRHDALMQLIASLGGAPGSGSDALLSSAASESELTM